jgi:hypothetical protein
MAIETTHRLDLAASAPVIALHSSAAGGGQ